MKLTVIIISACLYFLVKGFQRPYYFALAYVWLSLLYPQVFTTPLFLLVPWNAIFLILTLFGYIASGMRLPRITPVFVAFSLFFVWIFMTTLWAQLPEFAWEKWKWASTSVLTGLLFPLMFRTRKQIELLTIIVFAAILPHIMTAGLKSILGGGGYGFLATLMPGAYYLGESSTLAAISIMVIPVGYYLAKYSLASPVVLFPRLSILGFSLCSLACMIGTSARTGLVSLAAFVLFGIRGLRFKIAVLAFVAVAGLALSPLMTDAWVDRMRTIETYDDDVSASNRLVAWKWTANFVRSHPLGGGFGTYRLTTTVPDADGRLFNKGIASHSVYFEILGEHGFIGLGLYMVVAIGTTLGFYRLSRRREFPPHQVWIRSFSTCMFSAMVPFMFGAAFISIAFQPFGYTFFGIYLSVLTALRDDQPGEVPQFVPPPAYRWTPRPHPATVSANARRPWVQAP